MSTFDDFLKKVGATPFEFKDVNKPAVDVARKLETLEEQFGLPSFETEHAEANENDRGRG